MAPPVCPHTDEEVPPPEDVQSKSSDEEDPCGPPDDVAPDAPTLEWFWGEYEFCVWKSWPLGEKARQVAFKKEMAEEKVRYRVACEACEAVWKKEAVELRGWARHHAEEVYEDG
ncbi:Actin-related protein 2 [Hordeum vulgare]|nr:Actin-related protein 2 [Hordeum vulgare]